GYAMGRPDRARLGRRVQPLPSLAPDRQGGAPPGPAFLPPAPRHGWLSGAPPLEVWETSSGPACPFLSFLSAGAPPCVPSPPCPGRALNDAFARLLRGPAAIDRDRGARDLVCRCRAQEGDSAAKLRRRGEIEGWLLFGEKLLGRFLLADASLRSDVANLFLDQ